MTVQDPENRDREEYHGRHRRGQSSKAAGNISQSKCESCSPSDDRDGSRGLHWLQALDSPLFLHIFQIAADVELCRLRSIHVPVLFHTLPLASPQSYDL